MAALEDAVRTAVVRLHIIGRAINTAITVEERALWVAMFGEAHASIGRLGASFDARGEAYARDNFETRTLLIYACSLGPLVELEEHMRLTDAFTPSGREEVLRNIDAWRVRVDELWRFLTGGPVPTA